MQSGSKPKSHYMQKLTQKQMTDLKVELKLQNYQKKTGINLHDLRLCNGFLNTTTKGNKRKIHKLDFTKN